MSHFTKRTQRKMKPLARKLAKAAGTAEQLSRLLKKLAGEVNEVEFELLAWNKRQEHYRNEVDGSSLDLMGAQILSQQSKSNKIPR